MSLTSQENEERMGIFDYSANTDMNVLLRLRKLSTNEDPALANKDYESLDYDCCFNKPYRAMLEQRQKSFPEVRIEVVKWIVTFFVGFLTAMVALFIDTIVKLLNSWKFSTINKSVEECSMKGCLALSLLYLLLFDVLFVSLASCLTLYEPVAKGSGIPEIKCYLNGVRIPHVVRLRTLLSKAIGVLFSVAGGLFVGKEGPMIHSGAIIGAGVPQFQSIAYRKMDLQYSFFRTDRDKRDFVSGGAAAGVAAAFGAPIGGVLFSLEEGSSFWNQSLTWRTFFCSIAATFSLNFFLSGLESSTSWGYFYQPGLINFGLFKCANNSGPNCYLWNITDLLIFVIMAIIGGFLGATFNFLNQKLTKYRMAHLNKKSIFIRLLEALLVTMVTAAVSFTAAMTLGKCHRLSQLDPNGGGGNGSMLNMTSTRNYFCPEGYYNDMATLFFNPQEIAIKQLFHQQGNFSPSTLAIFFLFFFLLSCWTYGVCVPSGLFVPSLLCGAAYGRLVASILQFWGYQSGYAGTYALIGAAAFLGGVVRMTISLTVILIESTNEISYGLPIMLVLMIAKWIGDLFNQGLYDIHINLKNIPLLEWDSPAVMDRLTAADIMKDKVLYVFPHTRISTIEQILKTTAHNVFPVVSYCTPATEATDATRRTPQQRCYQDLSLLRRVDPQSESNKRTKLEGIILRTQLTVLLKNGVFFEEGSDPLFQKLLTYEEMTADYPRFPGIHEIDPAPILADKLLDVSPYMNPCPYTVYPNTPVSQVFQLFRSMGLRHLPVVSHDGEVVGMVTRHDLTHEHLESCLRRHQRQMEYIRQEQIRRDLREFG